VAGITTFGRMIKVEVKVKVKKVK